MSKSSLRVLMERGKAVTVRGLPKALEGKQGESIHQQLPGAKNLGAWQAIGWKAKEVVLEILDLDLMKVLVEAWGKYRTLAEFASEPRCSQQATDLVSIADHSVSVTFHPVVVVTVEGIGRGKLEFHLEVKATIQGILLAIRAGRIMSVRSGTCSGAVTLKLEDAVLVDQPFPEVELPGILELGDGLPIPRPGLGPSEPELERLSV